jgi:hypothetical protein
MPSVYEPAGDTQNYRETSQRSLFANLVLRASSSAANKDVKVALRYANQARTTTYSSGDIHNGPLPAANQWEAVGTIINPSTLVDLKWVRLEISRPTDTDFDLYLDTLELKQAPASMSWSRGISGTFPIAWTRVILPTTDYFSLVTQSTTSGVYQVNFAGRYMITGQVVIEDETVAAGQGFGIRLALKQDSGSATVYRYGTTMYAGTAYPDVGPLALNVATVFEFHGRNKIGGTTNTQGTVELEIIQHKVTPAPSQRDYASAHLDLTRITDR